MRRSWLLLSLAVVIGLIAAAASLGVTVTTSVDDDPILRLVELDATKTDSQGPVACGSVFDDPRSDGPISIEALARDRGCREEASLRRAAAVGAAALVAMTGMVGGVVMARRFDRQRPPPGAVLGALIEPAGPPNPDL